MRKVIASTFLSLDGIMQAPGGPAEDPTGDFRFGGWLTPYFDDIMGRFVEQAMASPFDLLLGRKTYEIFAAHWPYVEKREVDGDIAERFARCRKYVAASADEPLPWEGSVNLGADPVEAVRNLKKGGGPNLLIQGSSRLTHSLLSADLVDEITVMIAPVLLGKGKRLFDHGTRPGGLELVDHAVSSTGVMIGRYIRKGDVRSGSFAMERPSDAELARRDRMTREG